MCFHPGLASYVGVHSYIDENLEHKKNMQKMQTTQSALIQNMFSEMIVDPIVGQAVMTIAALWFVEAAVWQWGVLAGNLVLRCLLRKIGVRGDVEFLAFAGISEASILPLGHALGVMVFLVFGVFLNSPGVREVLPGQGGVSPTPLFTRVKDSGVLQVVGAICLFAWMDVGAPWYRCTVLYAFAAFIFLSKAGVRMSTVMCIVFMILSLPALQRKYYLHFH